VPIKILVVTAEAFPLAKTGGLGDAVSGLVLALRKSGQDVTLMLPAYRGVAGQLSNVRAIGELARLPGGPATLLQGHSTALGVSVLLLKNDALFDRDGLYQDGDGNEYADNAVRFAALSHAAARVASGATVAQPPEIVHAHDWHTALVPMLLRARGITRVKSVLTLHNLAFQGVCPMELAPQLGIPADSCSDGEFWGRLNFLKLGLRHADRITVVSGTYASEILTPRFGCGLQGVLLERRSDLVAIPNGIDTDLWNPAQDRLLARPGFDAADLGNKALFKRDLQRAFGLKPDAGATVMAMGSRLTHQKMADVAADAIAAALDAHPTLQAAVIGRGDKALEERLAQMARLYPGRCSVRIGFDEASSHLLHAGADLLLHGSRFEPFGLTPLYAMRYGTVPIGSRVGGMVDTILDPGPAGDTRAMRQARGILFDGDTAADMTAAIDRAMALRRDSLLWRAMQRNGMTARFGWEPIVPQYVRLFADLLPARARVAGRPAAAPSPKRRPAAALQGARAALREAEPTIDRGYAV